MAPCNILSRFSPEAFEEPKDFVKLAERLSSRIKKTGPGIRWKNSYATLDRFADRKSRHDHSRLWPLEYGNVGWYALEGFPCWPAIVNFWCLPPDHLSGNDFKGGGRDASIIF
jgi:hypothetical protein